SRVGHERGYDEVQAPKERHAVKHRSERAKTKNDTIENDVERRQKGAERQEDDEPRVLRRERRGLPIKWKKEKEHSLVKVLQRVRHREKPKPDFGACDVEMCLLAS